MERFSVLLSLGIAVSACGHADGLRVEWSEPPRAAAAEPSPEVVEPEQPDVYTIEVEPSTELFSRAIFYDPSEGEYVLRALDCSWQSHRCIGVLPYDARFSHYFTLSRELRRCPRVRLFRNGDELDTSLLRNVRCAYLFEADPD
ncbi:hypothetical protein IT407_00500 [Candidatus Uhrbacteria bacterium]|nr:hypothetical protein [Candidatus Uhrbacteria bacterium]